MDSYTKICYTCLKTDAKRLYDIHAMDIDKISYFDKVTTLINKELVTQDIMEICQNCIKELRLSVKFKQTVLLSQKTLRSRCDVRDYFSNETLNHQLVEFLKFNETDNQQSVNNYFEGNDNEDINEYYLVDVKSEHNISEADRNTSIQSEVILNDDKALINLDLPNVVTDKSCAEEHSKSIFNCDKCKDVFTKKTELLEHIVKKHSKQVCNKTANEDKSVHEFECIKCNLNYDKKADLLNHFKTNYCERKHVCEICKKRFKQRCHLREHMFTHLENKLFPCPDCEKKFTTESACRRHREKIHVSEENNLDSEVLLPIKRDDNNYILLENKIVDIKKYDLCETNRSNSLNGENIEENYLKNMDLEETITKDIHKEMNKNIFLTCNSCNKPFITKWELKQHINKIHSKVKNNYCTICSRLFKRPFLLTEHMASHTGELNYSCKICDKRFQRASSVKRHEKTHNLVEGQKTKRTPFLCNICGKSFPFSNGFQRHMVVHTGVKKHKCFICNRGFNQSTHLHVHMRTHTGEKPYICNVCGEMFSLKATLQKHMNIHIKKSSKYKIDDN